MDLDLGVRMSSFRRLHFVLLEYIYDSKIRLHERTMSLRVIPKAIYVTRLSSREDCASTYDMMTLLH